MSDTHSTVPAGPMQTTAVHTKTSKPAKQQPLPMLPMLPMNSSKFVHPSIVHIVHIVSTISIVLAPCHTITIAHTNGAYRGISEKQEKPFWLCRIHTLLYLFFFFLFFYLLLLLLLLYFSVHNIPCRNLAYRWA